MKGIRKVATVLPGELKKTDMAGLFLVFMWGCLWLFPHQQMDCRLGSPRTPASRTRVKGSTKSLELTEPKRLHGPFALDREGPIQSFGTNLLFRSIRCSCNLLGPELCSKIGLLFNTPTLSKSWSPVQFLPKTDCANGGPQTQNKTSPQRSTQAKNEERMISGQEAFTCARSAAGRLRSLKNCRICA